MIRNASTNMTIKHICCLLEFCLKNTYFKFNGKFYEQKEAAAMGSPISPIVDNLFMEDLETKAIRTSSTPPKIWRRFVDDTFTIIKKKNKNSFLQHLNSIHPSIKFTCEEEKEDGSMPFLDLLITPAENSSIHQCLENQLTLIYTCNGTATTIYHPNTVWLVPCTIEQPPYAQIQHCCMKKNNICSMH